MLTKLEIETLRYALMAQRRLHRDLAAAARGEQTEPGQRDYLRLQRIISESLSLDLKLADMGEVAK